MASTPSGSTGSGPSWPLIVALVAAFALVFAILPNPFRLPSDEPTTAAEFAPVPGKSDSNQAGSFSSVGFAEGGTGFALPTPPPPLPGASSGDPDDPDNVLINNRCVRHADEKLHQTDDPLSPICVSHFEGDNGGATMPGVTRDEVKIVFYNNLGMEGDMSGPYHHTEDRASPASWDTYNIRRTVKMLLKYFHNRYQLYGRRIRLIAQDGNLNAPAGEQEFQAKETIAQKPAGVIFFGNQANVYLNEVAKAQIPVFGLNQDVPRAVYEQNKPYVWSFIPDQETMAEWSASFLCRTLLERRGPQDANKPPPPARLSGDPVIRQQPRKLALIYGRHAQSHLDEEALLLIEEMKKQCGYEFPYKKSYTAGSATSGAQEAPDFMATAKIENVTTVICYCVPTESTPSSMQNAATNAQYFPEWYWDHASYMWRAIWMQAFGSKDERQRSIGTMYWGRNPAFRQQHHYLAFKAEDPNGEPNYRHNFTIYHNYLNLFSAIQGAGPRLQPGWAEKGMFTFTWRLRDDPLVLTGGYGPGGPSPYTFVDTGMAWWWDLTGTPPGGKQGDGCIRVFNEGYRYYAGEWPIGDTMVLDPGAPCSDDGFKLVNPEAG